LTLIAQTNKKGSLKISSGAMVSISDFDSDDVGSNPALIAKCWL
jgi:hypothetical protein